MNGRENPAFSMNHMQSTRHACPARDTLCSRCVAVLFACTSKPKAEVLRYSLTKLETAPLETCHPDLTQGGTMCGSE